MIKAIELKGLVKTEKAYLMRFIQSKVGSTYVAQRIQKDIQRLRNLQLFLSVKHTVQGVSGGKKITYHFQELITLLPIFNFGGISDNVWFQLGLIDHNWLGKQNTLGGLLQILRPPLISFLL